MAHRNYGLLIANISLFYMLLHEVLTASVPVTWVSDSRFVCGTFIYTPSSTNTGFVDDLVTVTYGSALTGAPSRMVALGIVDFQFRFASTSFTFYMVNFDQMNTGFVAEVYSDTQNNVKTLKVAFITVDPSFTDSFSINYFDPTTNLVGPFSASYYVNFTASTGVTLDLTHSNGMLAFQHILTATSPSQCFDLNIVFQIFNQSYYQVIVSTTCSMTVTQFGFSRIIFDKTAIQALGFSYFQFGELQASNGVTTPLSFTTTPFFSNNFMLGMKCFKVNGPSKLKFTSSIGTTTSISSTISFTYLSFMYWSYKLRQCPAGYPLFELATSLCYDVCPDGTYSNSTIYMCLPCSYTCLTCSSFSVCTNCNLTTNRFQNGTTCPPSPGYFDNGTSNTVPCSTVLPGCTSCTDNTTCLTCNSSYYILGTSCTLCSISITNCTTCIVTLGALTCTACTLGSTVGFANTTCVYNPCTDPYCVTCNTNVSVCTACLATGGFYLAANATCYTTCGDGFKVGTQQCDDGNNAVGDGCNADCTIGNNNSCPATTPYIDPNTTLCSATCPAGYYPNTTLFSCPACYYTCATCSNGTTCDSCSPTSNRALNNSQCDPNPGFFDNGTQLAPACVSPCTTCTSVSICTACVTTSYLSGTSCPLCSSVINNCSTCSPTGTACTLCVPGYIVNTTTFLCDVVPCIVANCASCPISNATCANCSLGFVLLSNTCNSVCGDGILVGTEQCDDGNNIDGDGCNADCTTGNNNSCPATAPYIDPNTSACTATCPAGYYADPTIFSFIPCMYTCATCSNGTTCDTCSPTSNRFLNNSQCDPSPGFYDNGTQLAPACVSPCSECTSVSICTACVTGSYLSGTSCPLCSGAMANCATCSAPGTSCTQYCQLGYIVNTTTFLCDVVPCYDLHCVACPVSMALCVTCVQGYQPAGDGTCQTVCGDFVVMGSEACDDGNSADNDGCSSTCTMETDFTCEPSPTNATGSACYYVGQVQVQKVYVKKVDGQNQVQVLLDLSPSNLTFWNSVDFLSMIQVNSPVPITGYTVTHNPDGTVAITVDYAQDLQGQSIDIQVNPAASGIPALSRALPSTSSVSIVPDDNKAALFYDDSTYKMADILSKVCTAIAAAAALVCVLGLISGKMIGVDMMAVVQISFFSLVTLSQLNPCFAALSSLRLVNGYNSLNKSNYLQDPMTPISPKGIFLFSRFTENFNFTLAVVAIPLLVALVSFILSKTALKENEKVLTVAKRAVGEYTLMGLLLGGYMIAVSSGLEAMYGSKRNNDLIGKVSLAECALLLALFVGYFVFLLLKPDFFGEFTDEFKRDCISPKYYNFVLVERLLVGAGLVLLLSVKAEVVLPTVLFVLTIIFVAVKSPHRENYQKYRVLANMTIAIVVEAVYMAYKMTPTNKQQSPIFIYMPFIVCGLLAVCVIYNAVAIVYNIYKMFKGGNVNSQQLAKEQNDEMARLRKQTMINSPSSPDRLRDQLNASTNLKQGIQPETLKSMNLNQLKQSIRLVKNNLPKVPVTESNSPTQLISNPVGEIPEQFSLRKTVNLKQLKNSIKLNNTPNQSSVIEFKAVDGKLLDQYDAI